MPRNPADNPAAIYRDSPDRSWALELLPPLLRDMRQQVLAAMLVQPSSEDRT